MLNLLENLEMHDQWNQKLKHVCRENGLKLGILNSLTLYKVKSHYSILENQ